MVTSVQVCTRLHTYVTYLRDQVFELWRNKNSNSFLQHRSCPQWSNLFCKSKCIPCFGVDKIIKLFFRLRGTAGSPINLKFLSTTCCLSFRIKSIFGEKEFLEAIICFYKKQEFPSTKKQEKPSPQKTRNPSTKTKKLQQSSWANSLASMLVILKQR